MIATQLFTLLSVISLAGARPTCKTHKQHSTVDVASYNSTSLNSTSLNSTLSNSTLTNVTSSSTSAVISAAAVWATPSAQADVEEEQADVPSSTWSSAAAAATTSASGSSGGGAVSGGFSGTATYYAAGLGACGWTNSDSDFVVAMNAPQYSGSNCGKNVRITDTVTGNTATAQVADLCPGCSYGDLDMSTSLFSNLHNGNMDAGVFSIKWEFV